MNIALIGAGNVATHLGRKLTEVGEEVVQVFSRNAQKAKQLADELKAGFTADLGQIVDSADIYIIAVNDDAIGSVAERLESNGLTNKLIVHTSGATPMAVFYNTAPNLQKVGVFYPLQSFSKIRPADFGKIPICIDARDLEDQQLLEKLAQKLSPHVYAVNDGKRAVLHLAAVFVNNFTNHLYQIGHNLLETADLPFELLMPLIQETVAKLNDGSPAAMQTGPAVRNDEATIRRHINLLEGEPQLQAIYRSLTNSIQTIP